MSTPPVVSHQYTPEDLLTMPDGHHFDLVDGHLVERHMGADRICSLRWCRPTICLGSRSAGDGIPPGRGAVAVGVLS